MTNVDHANFRQRLLDMLKEIAAQSDATQTQRKPVELDQQSVGRLSRMDAMQHQAMSKAQQARRNATQTRIRSALRRLDDNEFGFCLDCGEEIARQRLEFDPTLSRCLSCASG